MSNFKVGEKVVCVEPIYNLINGEIYEIEFIENCKCGALSFKLNGVLKPFSNYIPAYCRHCYENYKSVHIFDSTRFRKLDHQISEDVIAEIIKQVKKEV